jgi:uncharacterized membrane protein
MRNMEDKNENKEWNARWRRQIAEWRQEGLWLVGQAQALTEQAKHLVALIELAKSQIKRDPPE